MSKQFSVLSQTSERLMADMVRTQQTLSTILDELGQLKVQVQVLNELVPHLQRKPEEPPSPGS